MSAARLNEVEAALQEALVKLAPTNKAGEDFIKKAKAIAAGRRPPRYQWVDREELLSALSRVDTPTAKALVKELRKD